MFAKHYSQNKPMVNVMMMDKVKHLPLIFLLTLIIPIIFGAIDYKRKWKHPKIAHFTIVNNIYVSNDTMMQQFQNRPINYPLNCTKLGKRYPHTLCHKYWLCNQNGLIILRKCPLEQRFDLEFEECLHWTFANCARPSTLNPYRPTILNDTER